jgi:MFS family permease
VWRSRTPSLIPPGSRPLIWYWAVRRSGSWQRSFGCSVSRIDHRRYFGGVRRDLGLIAAGLAVSAFGTSVSRLVLMVQFKDAGAVVLSAVLVAAVLPASLGAPVAGLIVDRLPNRRLMQGAQLLQAGMMLLTALLLDNLVIVLIATLILGCGTAVSEPAAAALIPRAATDAAKGYSWAATARSSGYVLGTALGGVLILAIGARQALVLDAATYFGQAILLLFLKVERDPRVEGKARSRGGAMAGIRHLWRDRVMAISVGGLALAATCVVLINIADVFFITDVLHGGVVLISWVYAAWMVGAVLGAKAGARVGSQRAMVLTLGWGGVVLGISVLLPAVFAFTVVLMVCFLVGGVTNGMQNVARQSLVRLRTPEHLHGRAFAAVDSAMRTSMVVGTLTAGFVVTGLGPRWSMVVAGGIATVMGLVTVLAAREREPARVVETTRAG